LKLLSYVGKFSNLNTESEQKEKQTLLRQVNVPKLDIFHNQKGKISTSPTADKQCLILAKVSAARGRSPLANTSSTVELN